MLKQKHSKGFWSNKSRHREFFDALAKKLEIKQPSDWRVISREKIVQHEGSALLFNYYDGSIKKALQSTYPGSIHILENNTKKFNGKTLGSIQNAGIGETNNDKENFSTRLRVNFQLNSQAIGEVSLNLK